MTERNSPYVGVSGVVSREQQSQLIASAENLGLMRQRQLALGIKAVHKTTWLRMPNKYGPAWYPIGEIGLQTAVDPAEQRTYNIAQMYLDHDAIVASKEYPREFTARVMHCGRAVLHAVQFDMLPYHAQPSEWKPLLASIKQEGFDTILQCHKLAMDKGPRGAVEKLEQLADELDYVLFDASHGTGKTMDADALLQFCDAAYSSEALWEAGVNFGVAGGLDAETVASSLPRVLANFPDISWDAEGKLHVGTDDRSLNLPVTHEYLAASACALEE